MMITVTRSTEDTILTFILTQDFYLRTTGIGIQEFMIITTVPGIVLGTTIDTQVITADIIMAAVITPDIIIRTAQNTEPTNTQV